MSAHQAVGKRFSVRIVANFSAYLSEGMLMTESERVCLAAEKFALAPADPAAGTRCGLGV